MNDKLIKLFKQMYELTEPECAHNCRVPRSCCSPEYCDMAEQLAKDHNFELKQTDHPKLKYMSSTGCIVPPHFRPLCTLHVCSVNSLEFKPGDPSWTKKYFKLRRQIEIELARNRS